MKVFYHQNFQIIAYVWPVLQSENVFYNLFSFSFQFFLVYCIFCTFFHVENNGNNYWKIIFYIQNVTLTIRLTSVKSWQKLAAF